MPVSDLPMMWEKSSVGRDADAVDRASGRRVPSSSPWASLGALEGDPKLPIAGSLSPLALRDVCRARSSS